MKTLLGKKNQQPTTVCFQVSIFRKEKKKITHWKHSLTLLKIPLTKAAFQCTFFSQQYYLHLA